MAYGLWEQAGRPECRDQEFWFKAEQRLAGAAKPQAASIGQSRPKLSPRAYYFAYSVGGALPAESRNLRSCEA